MRNIFFLIISLLSFDKLKSQEQNNVNRLEINKPLPNIVFDDVKYYSKTKINTGELKDKWLVLDFWNEYCTACIHGFAKDNILQKQFSSSYQFLLVGYTGSQFIKEHSSNQSIRIL